jgi:hypothetical protein
MQEMSNLYFAVFHITNKPGDAARSYRCLQCYRKFAGRLIHIPPLALILVYPVGAISRRLPEWHQVKKCVFPPEVYCLKMLAIWTRMAQNVTLSLDASGPWQPKATVPFSLKRKWGQSLNRRPMRGVAKKQRRGTSAAMP